MATKKLRSYILLGYTEDGKEIRKWFSATTQRGLERKRIEVRRQYLQGELMPKNSLVRDLASTWLETKKMRARSTFTMYEGMLKNHVLPVIGHMKIADVRSLHLQQIINTLIDMPRTAAKVKNTLNQLFQMALTSDYVKKNPVVGLDMPTNRPKKKRRLTDIEKIALKRADLTLEQRVLVGLMMRCGLANNEVAGLRRRDIDLNSGRISIRGVVDLEMPPKERISAMAAYKPYPKVASRIRVVPIPDDLLKILEEYLPTVIDFLFLTRDGGLLTRSAYLSRWQAILNQWNMAAGGKAHMNSRTRKLEVDHWAIGKDLTPYYLRHEYASELMEAGYTLPEAMYLMGHSTRKMLLEVYAHVEAVKITADRLNAAKNPYVALTLHQQENTDKSRKTKTAETS